MTQLDSAQVMPAMTANIEITAVKALDVRFPTSHSLAGSDAMNLDPDYSAAYVIIETDGGVPVFGYSTAFTIGRGNDVQCAAVEALAPSLVGRRLSEVLADLGEVGRRLTHDSQFRWLGPEKGVMHMAIGAVLNALWDLRAKLEGKPLWRLLGELTPTETIDLIDFRYLSDVLLPHEALDLLEAAAPGKSARTAELLQFGYPAYTTAPGWLGYSDTKMVGLIREALAEGFTQIKLKVGGALADDVRRMALAREVCGPNIRIAVDANQRWDVEDAVTWIRALQPYNPFWVEEPTSTDDILGHAEIARRVAPTRIATGEQVANRVVFKQMLQARSLSVLQMDAARVAGVNENVAILLLAAKFGVPVCPHAGGVGLCEMVRHLSFFDYVAVSGSMDGRVIEYVDSLHEHFVDPALVRNGRYIAPEQPGFSTTMLQTSVERHIFTSGEVWTTPHPTTREGHHVI